MEEEMWKWEVMRRSQPQESIQTSCISVESEVVGQGRTSFWGTRIFQQRSPLIESLKNNERWQMRWHVSYKHHDGRGSKGGKSTRRDADILQSFAFHVNCSLHNTKSFLVLVLWKGSGEREIINWERSYSFRTDTLVLRNRLQSWESGLSEKFFLGFLFLLW